ncbi:hypothetical protein FACS1894199_10790 [Bacteroidia bacterium]|nr:hypothetical protein FACS1894199_10790 [Bacteroidia bacterium]
MRLTLHITLRLRQAFCTLLMLCASLSTFGQGNSVTVAVSLTPPYSLVLSDYAKPASQQLVTTIMVNDMRIVNMPVRLHIKMETATGVTIETAPNILVNALYLSGGMTHLLFGRDLAPYFDINNLNFKGYSKEDYRRTGQLPEGFYRFSVELRHFITGRPIGNPGKAMAWIAIGKPPTLKSPEDKAELGQIQGAALTFSWIPTIVGVPNGGAQYKFELWELRIPGINPNVIVQSMPAKYTATQMHSTLIVHPTEMFLEPGMQYAWRVTASDIAGMLPYAQEGHSEVRTFTYQCKCDSVTNFTVKRVGKQATFKWEPAANHTSFNVEMDNPGSDWTRKEQTFNSQATLNFAEGKTYRMRIQSICNGNAENASPFTHWLSVTIPLPKPIAEDCPNCACENPVPEPKVTNWNLRQDLKPGDTIHTPSGKTRFILKSVNQQPDGSYKGLLLVWIEIWRIKILCEYWDLSVNTDNQIVGSDYDYKKVHNPQFLLNPEAAKDYIDHLESSIKALTKLDNEVHEMAKVYPEDFAIVDFAMPENPITTITQAGTLIVTSDFSENSHTVELPKNEDGIVDMPVTIQDMDGKSFQMDDKGIITPISDSTGESSNAPNLKAKAYYLIEGNKFYNGETIYLPFSKKRYELKAYRDSINLFSQGSVWSGVDNVDSATVHFIPDVVSSNMNGTAISVMYSDSVRRDSLRCKIVVVSVEFEEDPTQKWGFDENDPQTENDYTSFKTTPIHKLKWKSLQANGIPDAVLVKILPTGSEKVVKFVPTNPCIQTTSFIPIGNSKNKLSISANRAIEANLVSRIGYFDSDSAQLKIKGLPSSLTKKLAIITINGIAHGSTELTSMMTIDELRDYMNKTVYNQADIKWEIDILPSDTIDYDINKDGKIEMSGRWPSNEMQLIINKYLTNTDYKFFLFLVNNPNVPKLLGKMGFNQRFGFIHVDNHRNKHQLQNTIAHELGHGAFGLKHPFKDFAPGYVKGKDRHNFMDYSNGDKIRAYHWEIIHE